MRTPETTIKEAILRPEEEVRLTALDYFTRSHRQDESLMPLVIQAVEKYGRDKAFRILRNADRLPQTAATVEWLTGELSKDLDVKNMENDNYRTAVAILLSHARVDLLRPEMAKLPLFPKDYRQWFLDRLEMAAWDWDTAWKALEKFGKSWRRRRRGPTVSDFRRAELVVEALARHVEKADFVLGLVDRRYRGVDRNLMEWLEPQLVELAGKMRIRGAVPILVDRLHEDDIMLGNSCTAALSQIGGDEVAQAIAEQWGQADSEFRPGAAEILGYVHTDLSAEKCREYFAVEEDENTRIFLARAWLEHFDPQSVEPVRQMVLEDAEPNPELSDLRYHLVCACTIMGVSFPEYDQWYKHGLESNWGWGQIKRERIRKNFKYEDLDEEEWEDEDFEDEDWEAEDYAFEEEDFGVASYKPQPFVKEQPAVGRNDPCPCGSGKKYKKCCMGKQQTPIP